MTSLMMSSVSVSARRDDIEGFFRGYGKLTDVALKHGFAFIEFESYLDAENAVDDLNFTLFLGNCVTVEFVRDKDKMRYVERRSARRRRNDSSSHTSSRRYSRSRSKDRSHGDGTSSRDRSRSRSPCMSRPRPQSSSLVLNSGEVVKDGIAPADYRSIDDESADVEQVSIYRSISEEEGDKKNEDENEEEEKKDGNRKEQERKGQVEKEDMSKGVKVEEEEEEGQITPASLRPPADIQCKKEEEKISVDMLTEDVMREWSIPAFKHGQVRVMERGTRTLRGTSTSTVPFTHIEFEFPQSAIRLRTLLLPKRRLTYLQIQSGCKIDVIDNNRINFSGLERDPARLLHLFIQMASEIKDTPQASTLKEGYEWIDRVINGAGFKLRGSTDAIETALRKRCGFLFYHTDGKYKY